MRQLLSCIARPGAGNGWLQSRRCRLARVCPSQNSLFKPWVMCVLQESFLGCPQVRRWFQRKGIDPKQATYLGAPLPNMPAFPSSRAPAPPPPRSSAHSRLGPAPSSAPKVTLRGLPALPKATSGQKLHKLHQPVKARRQMLGSKRWMGPPASRRPATRQAMVTASHSDAEG